MNAGLEVRNIVLVHGGFVDGSGWQGVYDHLTADGYRVAVVQNPTLSLAGDVAATHLVLDGLDGSAHHAAARSRPSRRCGWAGRRRQAAGWTRFARQRKVLLRATGAQFEADISFAALHQLLRPCFAELPQLSPLPAQALNVALCLGEGPPPPQLLVASAVLELLQQAAKEQPPAAHRRRPAVAGPSQRACARDGRAPPRRPSGGHPRGVPDRPTQLLRPGKPAGRAGGAAIGAGGGGIAGQPLPRDDSAGAAAAA